MDTAKLRERVARAVPAGRADLETLVRVPSVGHAGHDGAQVARAS